MCIRDSNEREGLEDTKSKKKEKKNPKAKHSATMTIVKMVMHTLEQLFIVSREVQVTFLNGLSKKNRAVPDSKADRSEYQHVMQLIEVDEA